MILISDWLFYPFVCQSLIGWQAKSCDLIIEVISGGRILTVLSFLDQHIWLCFLWKYWTCIVYFSALGIYSVLG